MGEREVGGKPEVRCIRGYMHVEGETRVRQVLRGDGECRVGEYLQDAAAVANGSAELNQQVVGRFQRLAILERTPGPVLTQV